MANYIRTSDGTYPVSETQIRADFPNTSFPHPFVPPATYKVVFPAPAPTYDPITKYVREIAPKLVSGKYYQDYVLINLDAEQIAANQAAALAAFIANVTTTTQARLDDFAKTRNYDGILSAASYAVSSNPPFMVEGRYCADMRDATWGALYTVMAEVQAGTRPMPATVADVIAMLPALVWPT